MGFGWGTVDLSAVRAVLRERNEWMTAAELSHACEIDARFLAQCMSYQAKRRGDMIMRNRKIQIGDGKMYRLVLEFKDARHLEEKAAPDTLFRGWYNPATGQTASRLG